MMREQAEPRAQTSSNGVEAMGLLPYEDEDLLGHVLRLRFVAEHAAGHTEHQTDISVIDLGQCDLVAGYEARRQLAVLDRASRRRQQRATPTRLAHRGDGTDDIDARHDLRPTRHIRRVGQVWISRYPMDSSPNEPSM